MRAARRAGVVLLSTLLLVGGLLAPPAGAAAGGKETKLAEQLVKKVKASNANRHLIAFQRIADANGGNRASATATQIETPGFDASVAYVVSQVKAAGFEYEVQEFSYPVEVSLASSLSVAGGGTFEIIKMTASIETPVGGVSGPLAVVPQDATTGCEAADFAGQDFTGKVALIRRGGCTFEAKALNAAAAGAAAAAISNNVDGPLANVTITNTGPIPVGGLSQADGDILAGLGGSVVTVDMRTEEQTRTSHNVIAQTKTGRKNNVVMVGAHLDSVVAGPGINDNGSGSAALLDIATQLGGSPKTNNAVRFAWWGAEELGLIGSTEYVKSLSFEQQLDIALYLNFDMVASPNAAYFVYDGDNSDGVGAGAGPYGSAQIEATFVNFFRDRLGVPTEGTDFSGRSDYGEFIANGIPAGGLFTGAEGIKTAAQAAKWGGTAGSAYDPCYHQKCDTLGNLDRVALDRNLDAAAWATGVYAYSTEEINGVPPRDKRAQLRAQSQRMSLLAAPDAHDHGAAAA